MKRIRVLSLGAGVQSTTIYLLAMSGEIPPIDAAIFADTMEEPDEVYRHLEWLESLKGPRIYRGTAGKLGDHLMMGQNSTGGRFAAIPAFTTEDEGVTVGKTRRQCSKEYKTEVIGRVLRREILGLEKGRTARGVIVEQLIGISLDEAGRASRLMKRPSPKYIQRRFPLIEMNWTRNDCLKWLEGRVPHQTPRSACVFCPYHNDYEWDRLRREDPSAFARAVEVDHVLRNPEAVITRAHTHGLFAPILQAAGACPA